MGGRVSSSSFVRSRRIAVRLTSRQLLTHDDRTRSFPPLRFLPHHSLLHLPLPPLPSPHQSCACPSSSTSLASPGRAREARDPASPARAPASLARAPASPGRDLLEAEDLGRTDPATDTGTTATATRVRTASTATSTGSGHKNRAAYVDGRSSNLICLARAFFVLFREVHKSKTKRKEGKGTHKREQGIVRTRECCATRTPFIYSNPPTPYYYEKFKMWSTTCELAGRVRVFHC